MIFGRTLCAAVLLAALAPAQDNPRLGESLFNSSCAGCHGLDGGGGEHAPDIATNPRVQQLSDKDLLRTIRNGIPSAGMPAFRSAFTEQQLSAVLNYLRGLQGHRHVASAQGDSAKGRALFFGSAQCSRCHTINGQGGFMGVDLSGYGKTHSAAEIRAAILNPGKAARATTVTTHDGAKFTGILRNEDNFSLQLQTPDGAFHFFEKSSVEQIERNVAPLMPGDYGQSLSKSDIESLITYLITAISVPTPSSSAAQTPDRS
jgi:cytochrome c oxidase cbb3-type subunit 3